MSHPHHSGRLSSMSKSARLISAAPRHRRHRRRLPGGRESPSGPGRALPATAIRRRVAHSPARRGTPPPRLRRPGGRAGTRFPVRARRLPAPAAERAGARNLYSFKGAARRRVPAPEVQARVRSPMAPPASRRSVVAVEVRASESGPVLRGVILQEGRAATGGRAEVFSPGAVHWPDDGIALRLQHLGPEAARALPRRDPNGELHISTPATPEIIVPPPPTAAGLPRGNQPPARPTADHAPRGRGRRNRGAVRDGESGRRSRCGGSLIRHAAPNAIGALPVAVVEAPFGTALMSSPRRLHRPPATERPAGWRAVGVAAVAGRADREETAAMATGALAERVVHGVGARRAGPDWTARRIRGTTAGTGSVCRSSRRSRGSRKPLRALTPRLSPPRTLPERAAPRQRRGCGRRRSGGRQRARPPELCKTAQTRFCTAPTASLLLLVLRPERTQRRAGRPTGVEIRSVPRDR